VTDIPTSNFKKAFVKAELHQSEDRRLAALRSYQILDTPREEEFDDVVKVVSAICDAPISVINLIDDGRQWFKAEVGLGVRETPIDSSLCAHAILQPGLFIVPDTTLDRRFTDNPLVTGDPHLRFYAGALLETSDGMPLGTVCVLDYKPRELDDTQKAFLRLMASQVMKALELRKLVAIERAGRLKAELIVEENRILAREGDHRVMNSLQLVQSVLSLQIRSAASDDVRSNLESARNRVLAIAAVHKELHLGGSLEDIEIAAFLRRICGSLKETAPPTVTAVNVTAADLMMRSDLASAVGLIVAELVTNSFKYAYADPASGPVDVSFTRIGDGWSLSVADTGRGLPADFDVTKTTGVGMRVVTALVRRLNAELSVASSAGRTRFTVTSKG
jgi:two-component sensor histidine kinase